MACTEKALEEAITKIIDQSASYLKPCGINIGDDEIKELRKKVKDLNQLCDKEKVFSAFMNIWAVVPNIKGGNIKKKVISILEIISNILLILGKIEPKCYFVGIAIRYLGKFLMLVWKDKEVLTSLKRELNTDGLQHYVAGIEREFGTAASYLCRVQNRNDTTSDDVNAMLSSLDIKHGIKVLGILTSKFNDCIYQQDADHAIKAIRYATLYVRIATFRAAMLWQMYSVVLSSTRHDVTADAIHGVIQDEGEKDKEFIQALTIPTLNNATVFSFFDPSNCGEIEKFILSKGLQPQQLKTALSNTPFCIHFPRVYNYSMIMANDPWGTIWGTGVKDSSDLRMHFLFDNISEKDNYFYIRSRKWPDFYVYQRENFFCIAKSTLPGPEGQWKILRLENGQFLMCTKKCPGKFIYMESSFLYYVRRQPLQVNSFPVYKCIWSFSKQTEDEITHL